MILTTRRLEAVLVQADYKRIIFSAKQKKEVILNWL